MKTSFTIRELSKEEMFKQLPLVLQLSPYISQKDYERMLEDMLKHFYRMAGVFDGDTCIGISGFWIATKFYCDKYLELDNVVIDENYRSQGIGKLLLDLLTEEAKQKGCTTLLLDAYLENKAAHKFYEREGFRPKGYHFLKRL